MERTLNDCQWIAFNQNLEMVCANAGQLFFLDGLGGFGKAFLYNCLLSRLHGEGHIALACASSRIAALLLTSGCT